MRHGAFLLPLLLAVDPLQDAAAPSAREHGDAPQASEAVAEAVIAEIAKTNVVPLDESLALAAADTSLELGLAMADAVVYATALTEHATLVTSDADLQHLPSVQYLKRP